MATDSGEKNTMNWRRNTKVQPPPGQEKLACPRCDSTNTKFSQYSNYKLSQPRYFCNSCRRPWTHGGTLRDIPGRVGTCKRSRPGTNTNTTSTIPTSPVSFSAAATVGQSVPLNQGGSWCLTTLLEAQGPGFRGFGLEIGAGYDQEVGFGGGGGSISGMMPFSAVADGGVGNGDGMGNTGHFICPSRGGVMPFSAVADGGVGNGNGDGMGNTGQFICPSRGAVMPFSAVADGGVGNGDGMGNTGQFICPSRGGVMPFSAVADGGVGNGDGMGNTGQFICPSRGGVMPFSAMADGGVGNGDGMGNTRQFICPSRGGVMPFSAVTDGGVCNGGGMGITEQFVRTNKELYVPVCLNKKVDQMKFTGPRKRRTPRNFPCVNEAAVVNDSVSEEFPMPANVSTYCVDPTSEARCPSTPVRRNIPPLEKETNTHGAENGGSSSLSKGELLAQRANYINNFAGETQNHSMGMLDDNDKANYLAPGCVPNSFSEKFPTRANMSIHCDDPTIGVRCPSTPVRRNIPPLEKETSTHGAENGGSMKVIDNEAGNSSSAMSLETRPRSRSDQELLAQRANYINNFAGEAQNHSVGMVEEDNNKANWAPDVVPNCDGVTVIVRNSVSEKFPTYVNDPTREAHSPSPPVHRNITLLEKMPEETNTCGAENGGSPKKANDNEAGSSGSVAPIQSFITTAIPEYEARIIELERIFAELQKFPSN